MVPRPRRTARGAALLCATLSVASGCENPVDTSALPSVDTERASPRLDRVGAPTHASAVTPEAWDVYDVPRPRGGRVIGRTRAQQRIGITARWAKPGTSADTRATRQWMRLQWADPCLDGDTVWADLPAQWIEGRVGAIPARDPGGRIPLAPVPAGRGARLHVDEALTMRSHPGEECGVIAPVRAHDRIPVTGRATAPNGAWWLRIEQRQRIGWVPEAPGRVQASVLRLVWLAMKERTERTCTQLAMDPRNMWGVCTADLLGRMRSAFERKYDRLDPVEGRETLHHHPG